MSSSNIVLHSRTSASSSARLHTSATLLSYTVPLCNKSSVNKSDLIQALASKTNTKEVKFNCSKDEHAMVLIPIIRVISTNSTLLLNELTGKIPPAILCLLPH